MTLAEATTIVLKMAEAKWYRHWFGRRKTTKEQDQAIRILSSYVEHGTFPDKSISSKQIKEFYLVTGSLDGEGAYYHAIFSNKEKADNFIKKSNSNYYDYDVEPLFLDEPK